MCRRAAPGFISPDAQACPPTRHALAVRVNGQRQELAFRSQVTESCKAASGNCCSRPLAWAGPAGAWAARIAQRAWAVRAGVWAARIAQPAWVVQAGVWVLRAEAEGLFRSWAAADCWRKKRQVIRRTAELLIGSRVSWFVGFAFNVCTWIWKVYNAANEQFQYQFSSLGHG